jgi:transposase
VLEEGIRVSKQGVRQFLKRFAIYKTIARKPGSGLPPKLSPAIQQLIEQAMRKDDETTATQLQAILASRLIYVSLSTIVRNRRELGWTFRGSAYCQLIRHANKQKRLNWAQTNLHDDFNDVIWSDETTVQLETHRRYCYRKEGERPIPKPRPKHPTKVHVWAAISKRGATSVCIFDGIMEATLFCEILERTLLPFLRTTFHPPCTHRFMQDNDPKHTSRAAQDYYAKSGINWWKTPAESPDLNPIENLWHELKEFIRREVKPTSKNELVNGIIRFWDKVDEHKCCRYINHFPGLLNCVVNPRAIN